jgi:RHS repeat-associated protein
MIKSQAHPGKALQVNNDGIVTEVDANPRWIGNGRTILNNKGNPVKQYEPYFSTTYEYEGEKALREIGVTPIFYYDALGRNTRTLFPNGTFTKVEFNSWMQKVFDTNDTVKESQWYIDRGSPDPATQPEPLSDPERRAAWLAAKHANTPGIVHFDSLGRSIYTISDYGGSKIAAVRSESDLTGRFSKLFDQKQREVASGFVGMPGKPIYGENAEKGRRWIFHNVLGTLVKTWDEYGREFHIEYDIIHRPVSAFVQESGHDKILFNYVVYGDRHPNAQQLNLLGIVHQIFDQAGMVRVPELDFKGNPKSIERILAKDYKNDLDWNSLAGQASYASIQTTAGPILELGEVFIASSAYDALNRPVRVTLPDGTVIVPAYNEANFLSSLRAQIRGQGSFIDFLKGQDYDAKGQRQFAHYGNDLFTRYFYDPDTFRLINLLTYKSGDDPNSDGLQNLQYIYDPVGNITYIRDDAQQTHYFNNSVVKPESLFEYDAMYQLVLATGREHAGLTNDSIRDHDDLEFVPQLPHPNNSTAVRTYTEEYEYDLLGNIKTLRHRFKTQSGVGNGWRRYYHYAYEDEPTNRTNRLNSSSLPGDPEAGPYSATYGYDTYGNMTRMPHLADLDWNFMDQLRRVDLGGGGTAYYVYGVGGQRIRKVIERLGATRTERIYLGAVEIYRQRQGNSPPHLERYTTHISDNMGRIAQVDTKTIDDNNSDPANPLNAPLIRYQCGNHLGSATLETNADGVVISYEEYHPYGTSAYRSAKPGFNLSLKRYRFTGKELDDESGLYYFGARYYAAWLGRWISSDPAGFVDGWNLFSYVKNNPVNLRDNLGLQSNKSEKKYGTIWTSKKAPTKAEQKIIGDPSSDPGKVLEIYKKYGYPGEGPLKWVVDEKSGVSGWLDTSVNASKGGTGESGGGGTSEEKTEGKSVSGAGGEGEGASQSQKPSTPAEKTAPQPPAPSQPPASSAESERPEMAPVPDAARAALQEVARPSSITGTRPSGTLHLWSGQQGKAEARAEIRRSGSGWMMGDIEGAPTPQHVAGETEFNAARSRAPGGQLTQAEFERIWGMRSASVVGRGAFAGHPVQAHGTPAPTSIQARYEWPARAIGGGAAGGLFIGSGMFTAITGGQDPNPAVAIPLVLSGVGEATSGIIYGSGAILGDTALMGIGATGATAFGGAGAMVGFGVASYRSFNRGDTTGGVVNALGAIGGALMIASLFTPVGWVGLLGVGLVAFAGGFNLGRWLSD